jgi:hypothetical protein
MVLGREKWALVLPNFLVSNPEMDCVTNKRSKMMKKFIMLASILALLALPTLALAVPAAPVDGTFGSFDFLDSGEGVPAVGNGFTTAVTNFTQARLTEHVIITGTLTGDTTAVSFLHPGDRAVIFTSPGDVTTLNQNGYSDVLLLHADGVVGTTAATQNFSFTFASDEAHNFASDIATAIGLGLNTTGASTGYISVVEDGTLQNVNFDWPAGLDAEDAFSRIGVQSDVDAVPLPPSALLLGSGLLGLVGLGWRRRKEG